MHILFHTYFHILPTYVHDWETSSESLKVALLCTIAYAGGCTYKHGLSGMMLETTSVPSVLKAEIGCYMNGYVKGSQLALNQPCFLRYVDASVLDAIGKVTDTALNVIITKPVLNNVCSRGTH